MASRMPTRGKAMTVPTKLIPRSHAEMAETRRKRTKEKELQKKATEKLKRLKKERQQQGKKKVAAQEDANAREDKQIQSLCPDLDLMKKGLPPPSHQSQNKKPAGHRSQPSNILPQVTTPIIMSPSSPFTEAALADTDGDIDSLKLESPDDLPPVSVVATSESEGLTDGDMEVDSDSACEAAPLATEMITMDDDGSDDDYQEEGVGGEEGDNEEDEEILYQEFLAQRRKTDKKVNSDRKAGSNMDSSAIAKPSKAKVSLFVNKQGTLLTIFIYKAGIHQARSSKQYHRPLYGNSDSGHCSHQGQEAPGV